MHIIGNIDRYKVNEAGTEVPASFRRVTMKRKFYSIYHAILHKSFIMSV